VQIEWLPQPARETWVVDWLHVGCLLTDRAVLWPGEQDGGARPRDGTADDAGSLLVREAPRCAAGQPDGDGQPHTEVLRCESRAGARRGNLLPRPAGAHQARPPADCQLAADQ